jgi:hypothetical protein
MCYQYIQLLFQVQTKERCNAENARTLNVTQWEKMATKVSIYFAIDLA